MSKKQEEVKESLESVLKILRGKNIKVEVKNSLIKGIFGVIYCEKKDIDKINDIIYDNLGGAKATFIILQEKGGYEEIKKALKDYEEFSKHNMKICYD